MLKKNIFSILIALVIAYLSLANSENFGAVKIPIPHFDKIVHMGMYFVLMSAVIIENRKTLHSGRRMFIAALIPASYGILMEFLQQLFTITRTASFLDAAFDIAGILFSILFFLFLKPVDIRSK
ncbi:MAG TPA: VanZ family protein [Bacteroidales bacterium]|nr:VanZ family protein [Bacteroidales bacterium]